MLDGGEPEAQASVVRSSLRLPAGAAFVAPTIPLLDLVAPSFAFAAAIVAGPALFLAACAPAPNSSLPWRARIGFAAFVGAVVFLRLSPPPAGAGGRRDGRGGDCGGRRNRRRGPVSSGRLHDLGGAAGPGWSRRVRHGPMGRGGRRPAVRPGGNCEPAPILMARAARRRLVPFRGRVKPAALPELALRAHTRSSPELSEEPHVVFCQQPDVADAVAHHTEPLHAEAERETGDPFRGVADGFEHVRVDHAGAAEF